MTEYQRRGESSGDEVFGDADFGDDEAIADSLALDEAVGEQPTARHAAPSSQDASPRDDSSRGDVSHAQSASAEESSVGGATAMTPRPTRASRHRKPEKSRSRKRGKPRRKAPWWELPALVALAILIAILVKSFLVQPFFIPSESMEKTLHGCPGCSGDRILVSKIIYDFRDPHPGDIVVFNAPTGWNDEPPSVPPTNPVLRTIRGFGQLVGFVPPDGLVLVKRVIAVGGQTVKGDAHNNVYISDHGDAGPWRKLQEKFVYETGADARATFGPITVPKGRLWVMGDHRDRSADSRYHCGLAGADGPFDSTCDVDSATVPVNDVIGKAFVIAWPPSRWRTLGTPSTFTAGIVLLPVAVRRRRRRRQ